MEIHIQRGHDKNEPIRYETSTTTGKDTTNPYASKAHEENEVIWSILVIIFDFVLPPFGVFLQVGLVDVRFWISVLLTIIGWIPGIIFALYVFFTAPHVPINPFHPPSVEDRFAKRDEAFPTPTVPQAVRDQNQLYGPNQVRDQVQIPVQSQVHDPSQTPDQSQVHDPSQTPDQVQIPVQISTQSQVRDPNQIQNQAQIRNPEIHPTVQSPSDISTNREYVIRGPQDV